MRKRSLKKSVAIVLAATMTFGSAMTVFAEAGVSEGEGSYEGGAMKYPTLSVTLPTIPEKTYDYIADPNGLIKATNNAKYSGATFADSAKGIFFQTSTNQYSEKSAAQKLTNQNAQDIDVTIKLEQKDAGDASIKYADSATFDVADKEKKLYLAVTDDAATDKKTQALSADAAATITKTIEGMPDNYIANYDSTTKKYEYKQKDDAANWKECSFIMTGALNMAAEWGDDLTFPTVKVTWSYAEHIDTVDAHYSSYENTMWVSVSETEGFAERPSSITVNGTAIAAADYTMDTAGWVTMPAQAAGSVVLITVGTTVYKLVIS